MLLKYTLKNIFSKPGRLFILLVCMTTASIAGFVAVDFGKSFKGVLLSSLSNMTGKADYYLYNTTGEGVTEDVFEGLDDIDYEYVQRKSFVKHEFKRDEKLYSYALTDEIDIEVFGDLDKAREMDSVAIEKEPGDYEIAISPAYSEKYGYEVGDTIMVPDIDNEDVPFTVCEVLSEKKTMDEYSAVISVHSYELIRGKIVYRMADVNIIDDDQREDFEAFIKENRPTYALNKAYLDNSLLKAFDSLMGLFYLMFVLVFVLVVFVTVSFTEKIITERMSVIGTLRSIGMSMRKTTMILLFENVVYALLGGILGLILYLVGRALIINVLNTQFLSFSPGKVTPNYPMFAVVIIGAVLVQVLVPLIEVRRAVNTSIRDIIFETRDSEYKISYKKTYLGAAFIVLGLVLGFAFRNLYVMSTGVLLIIVGAALTIQFIVRKLTLILANFFGKKHMPVAELACMETGSKKPNSGNAVLAIASVTAAAAIYVIVSSMMTTMSKPLYDADIVIEDCAQKPSKYEYISELEGIDEINNLTLEMDSIKSGDGEVYQIFVYEHPKGNLFLQFGEIPAELGKYELVIDKPMASRLGVKEGDTIPITFHANGLFPYDEEFTIKKITDETEFGSTGYIIMSEELFKEFYVETVSTILIRTDDPEGLKAELEPTFTLGETVKTRAEVEQDNTEKNAKTVAILVGIMIAAVGLTLIGISGNQLIGFTARKKEYAMLHSCACSRKKIIRLILIENALLFGISCICAGIICIPVSYLIARIMDVIDMGMTIDVHVGTLIGCIFILWVITMFTSTTPIKSLRKMNTAMELKYE